MMQLTDREQAIVTALSTKIDSLQQALVKYQTDVLLPLTKQASDQITAAAQERNKLIEQAIQEEKKVAGLVKDLPDKVERGVKQATKNHVDDMLARERQVEGKAAEFRAEGARHADKTNAAIILQRLCRKARMEIMPGKQWEAIQWCEKEISGPYYRQETGQEPWTTKCISCPVSFQEYLLYVGKNYMNFEELLEEKIGDDYDWHELKVMEGKGLLQSARVPAKKGPNKRPQEPQSVGSGSKQPAEKKKRGRPKKTAEQEVDETMSIAAGENPKPKQKPVPGTLTEAGREYQAKRDQEARERQKMVFQTLPRLQAEKDRPEQEETKKRNDAEKAAREKKAAEDKKKKEDEQRKTLQRHLAEKEAFEKSARPTDNPSPPPKRTTPKMQPPPGGLQAVLKRQAQLAADHKRDEALEREMEIVDKEEQARQQFMIDN